jgi:hypothetical protein
MWSLSLRGNKVLAVQDIVGGKISLDCTAGSSLAQTPFSIG